jgi:PAS domain S-box-containing protein
MIRILHVDDNQFDQEIVSFHLMKRASDFRIDPIRSGLRALELISSDKYDCVLCDYQMPEINGLDMVKSLRDQGNQIPFIFLTGQGNEDLAAEALRAHADDYFTKENGFAHYERLIHSIRKVVDAYHSRNMRDKAEAEEKKLKRDLNFAQQIAHIGNWSIDWKNNSFICSEETLRILGVSKCEFNETYESFLEFIHPEDRKKFTSQLKDSQKTLRPISMRHRIIRKDGEIRYVHERSAIVRDEDNTFVRYVGTIQDITSAIRTEKALKDSEARFRGMFNSAAIGLIVVGKDNRLIQANESICQMLGYTEGEILKESMESLTHPDDVEKSSKLQQDLIDGISEHSSVDKRYIRKDGTVFWANVTVSAVMDADGKPTQRIVQVIDINERKRIEEELRQSRALFNAFMEQFPGGAIIKDSDGRIVYSNQFMNNLFGGKNITGKRLEEILPSDVADQLLMEDKRVVMDGPLEVEEVFVDRDNKPSAYHTLKFPITQLDRDPLIGSFTLKVSDPAQSERIMKKAKDNVPSE